MKITLIIGGLLLLFGGCSLANSYLVEERLAQVPRMTCDQLLRNGAPADGQVTLTDLQACSRGFVAVYGSPEYGHLDLYIPAYGAGLGKEPDPPALNLLLQIWDEDQQHKLLNHPGPVEGTCWARKGAREVQVSRGPGEIEEWASKGIRDKYPGIRLANVWVLTFGHGSTPTTERVLSARQYGIWELLIGSAALCVGAVLSLRCVDKSGMAESQTSG
jgi:hypothetical protein